MKKNTSRSKQKPKEKLGRKEKVINKKQFEELCNIQCTKTEICNILGITDKTLDKFCRETYDNKHFSEVFKEKSASGKASLRRMQYKAANNGNSAVLIWLGKQYLGQEDISRQKIEAEVTANVRQEIEAKIRAEIEQEINVQGSITKETKLDLSGLDIDDLEKLLELKSKIKEVESDE